MQAVKNCGFVTPTPIQQQTIAHILEGRDLLGLAQTGTGKTAAFILPIVQQLLSKKTKNIRTLIIAPTRELAEQIHAFASEIIAGTGLRSMAVYGGVSKHSQLNRIRQGVDIVVACPGRLLDIINDRAIDLRNIENLVLDEADHMFDQGFLPDIRRILKNLPQKRQTLVFSATMPTEIRKLAEDILYKPVSVQVNKIKPADTVEHSLYSVSQSDKTRLLLEVLRENSTTTTLVFTRTKYKAKNLAAKLSKEGFKAISLQGNMTQNKRQQALQGFKNGTYTTLVATDIAARGIDVSGISHVINFDAPDTAEAYIHRTGRTGRAQCTGKAVTFATAEDNKIIHSIERSLEKPLYRHPMSLQKIEKTEQVRCTSPEKKVKSFRGKKKKAYQGSKARHSGTGSAPIFGLTVHCK